MIFKELGITSQQDATGADSYGSSIAVNAVGDLIAVGAPSHDSRGAVYVYRRNHDGTRTFLQKITASDNQIDAKFGFSLALSDDGMILVVGSPDSTGDGGRTNHGAAYLYFWNGSSFTDEQKLLPSGSLDNTHFGYALTISRLGQYIAVGNDADDEAGCLVYTYMKTGATSFTFMSILENPRADAYVSKFGQAVSLDRSGSLLLVGAPDLAASNDPTFTSQPGGGFVFERRGGIFDFRSSIYFTTGGFPFIKFGASVAISDSTLAFGAPGYNNGQGAVAFFNKTTEFRSETIFQNKGKLLEPSTGAASDIGFGSRISLDGTGNKILVGMYGSGDTIGKVWYFEIFSEHDPILNTGPCGEQIWEVDAPSTLQADQRYGAGVALSKDGLFAIVGSPSQDLNGAVWFYKNRIYSLQIPLFNQPLPNEIDSGISFDLINGSYNFIPPVSKIAQRAASTFSYAGTVGFTFDKSGSPTGNINVKIVYGDSSGPYESNPLAVLHSGDLDVTTITAYGPLFINFDGKHRIIQENDQIWVVLTGDSTYLSSADSSNYVTIYGTTSSSLPFKEYNGTWQDVPFNVCYTIGSFGLSAQRGEIGRLVTTPYDIRNSIYTLKSAPYSVRGGEKIMFEKNGFLKQTLTLPAPAIFDQLTQTELIDFLNSNLNEDFNCTAEAAIVEGKDVVVVRNNDFFLNSVGLEEGNSFIRMDSEWDLSTDGTTPADNAFWFTNGAVYWAFKPDRMSDYGILPSSSYSDWHDWHENIHKPLQHFYYSKSDRYNPPPYDYRVKITMYPIGADADLQWSIRSFYEFVIENFIMNPQIKKALDLIGVYSPVSLSEITDQYYINIVYSYKYDATLNQPLFGAVWFR